MMAVGGDGAEIGRRFCIDAERFDEGVAIGFGRRQSARVGLVDQQHVLAAGAGLHGGLVKQAARLRRDHQLLHGHAARAFAEDGDVAGVAAEGRDVALHPFERGDHVHHAVVGDRGAVGLLRQQRMRERTEAAEAVVDRDEQRRPLGEL